MTPMGSANSNVVRVTVIEPPPEPVAAAVTFSPLPAVYTRPVPISLACATPGSTIYFTVDGTVPTYPPTGTTSEYLAPFDLDFSQANPGLESIPGFWVNAIAVAAGYQQSPVARAYYGVN